MKLKTVGGIALSVVSSVSIVVVNKFLVTNLGFHFMSCLTALHMLATAIALSVAGQAGLFEPKGADNGGPPTATIVHFACLTAASIASFNLSLEYNSVGFYQMTKLAVVPCTVAIQSWKGEATFSHATKVALCVLILGLMVSSVTDMDLNLLGCFFSAVAVLSTCIQQMATARLQKEYEVSSTQLLARAALWSFLVMLLVGPPLDAVLTDGDSPLRFEYSVPIINAIALSSVCAIAVNMATFFVIGATSPVTYQVVGHAKTVLVLTFGFTVLHEPVTLRNVSGVAIAFFGMVLYTREKLRLSGDALTLDLSSDDEDETDTERRREERQTLEAALEAEKGGVDASPSAMDANDGKV